MRRVKKSKNGSSRAIPSTAARRSTSRGLTIAALTMSLLGAASWIFVKDVLNRAESRAVVADDDLSGEFQGSYPEAVSASGTIHDFILEAAPSSIELFSGKPTAVWAYNQQVPGPTLRVKLGDTVRVLFRNRLPQPTTVHWHGVRVPNAMDGVPGVTQDPVEPEGTFTYEFVPKDAGTFWFHPHLRSSEQVERGLFGTLIVEESVPTPFSRELVWVLDDWLLKSDGSLSDSFVTRHDLAHDGRWGNVVTVNGTRAPPVAVSPGERLRIRLVNVANGRVFDPRFPGLEPSVIAMDGMSIPSPRRLERLDFAPGNRVDLDLVIPMNAAGRTFEVVDGFARERSTLVRLVVDGRPVETPRGDVTRGKVPEWRGAAALAPDHVMHLNARAGGPYGIEWTINDRVMRHEVSASTDHSSHSAPYFLQAGRFAKIRFVNDSARLHPMHIHGVFFKVLARNGADVDEPQWRDTVLLRGRETIDVGLVPLDEGRWMLHCHILEHAESGMMTLVEVAKDRPKP
jgi:FtsP/CotA-like multicopper oxidase with cupredoxin domain